MLRIVALAGSKSILMPTRLIYFLGMCQKYDNRRNKRLELA